MLPEKLAVPIGYEMNYTAIEIGEPVAKNSAA